MPKIIFRLDDIFEYLNEWGKACDFDPSDVIDEIKSNHYLTDEIFEDTKTDYWGEKIHFGNKLHLRLLDRDNSWTREFGPDLYYSFFVSNYGWDIGNTDVGYTIMLMNGVLPRNDIWRNILLKNHPQEMAECLIDRDKNQLERTNKEKIELARRLETYKKLYLPETKPIKNVEEKIEKTNKKIEQVIKSINELSKKYGIEVDIETLAATYGVDLSKSNGEESLEKGE